MKLRALCLCSLMPCMSYVNSTHDTPAYRPLKSFEGLQLLEDDRYVGCIIYTFVHYSIYYSFSILREKF